MVLRRVRGDAISLVIQTLKGFRRIRKIQKRGTKRRRIFLKGVMVDSLGSRSKSRSVSGVDDSLQRE